MCHKLQLGKQWVPVAIYYLIFIQKPKKSLDSEKFHLLF